MKITGITLITKQEYEKNKSIIPSRDFSWIAIGSGDVIEFMGTTPHWKSIADGDAFYDSYDMSPILICDSIPYSPGTKIEFAGLKWTVISQNRMFADGSIGSNQLTKRTSQLGKCRSLTISETQCIPYIENWLIRHRKEPIYLLGNKKKIPIS